MCLSRQRSRNGQGAALGEKDRFGHTAAHVLTHTVPWRTFPSPDITSNVDEDFVADCLRVTVVLGGSFKVISMAGLHIIRVQVGWCRMKIRTEGKTASSQFCTLFCLLLPCSKPVILRLDGIKNRSLQDLGYKSHFFHLIFRETEFSQQWPAALAWGLPARGQI